jgi:putative ATP-dependent endonuclease of the OLD family
MKLKRLRIRNFRCYQEEILIDFEDFTTFVGRNDSGKSTILDALALFFDEYKPDGDDANIGGNKQDMRIICEFCDLPEEIIIDTDHPTTLNKEYLLNNEGNLEVHRIFSGQNKTPKQTGIFAYADHPTIENYADLLYLKRKELQDRATELGVKLSGVDKRINSALRQAIWESAPDLSLQATEIDLEKVDAKKIWAVLSKQRPVFAIFHSDRKSTDQDDEAQSPLKSAVDEAIKEKQVELDDIAEHVKNQVEKIARDTVEKIREMDQELAQELNPRFSKPNWAKVFSISLTDDEQISINKRGSGVRRLILLNFFRAKAERRLEQKDAPGVIYAIEEPETSQHPNNQKLLISALRELSEQPGCQVIITTHTPVLVKDLPIESLRYIQKTNDTRQVFAYDEVTYNCVAKALGIIPDHDVKIFVGLEGVNDIDFMKNISKVLIDNGENVIDLTELEENGEIIFIPLGGSSLSLWTHRLAGLNRPEFHLYDRDDEPPATSRHQDAVDQFNARDNSTAILTGKREMENYIHSDAILDSLGVTIIVDDFCDVPDLVAEQLHIANGGQGAWDDLDSDKKKKKNSRAKRRLNNEVLESMTVERLNFIDQDNDVRKWLSEIKRLYEA